MSYFDAVVTPVPSAAREAFIAFSQSMDTVFVEYGALRIVDAWGTDVSHGKVTDMYRAVAATDAETVVFSFIEWPDKATRDAAWGKVMEDPRLVALTPPFDGKRMIWGGFDAVVDQRAPAA